MAFSGGFASNKGVGRYPGGGGSGEDVPKTTVELAVSCAGLADADYLSKSDPVCVLYTKTRDSKWVELDRTEEINNTLNPNWLKKFVLEYRFEEKQEVRFLVLDSDSSSRDTRDHDNIGELTCSLGEIVSRQSSGFTKPLYKGKGTISILATEVSKNNEVLHFSVSALGLDNKDTFGKSDPFLQIHRVVNGSQGPVMFRTETIQNNLNPNWKPFSLESRRLCNGDHEAPLLFSVYDEDDNGAHDLIGTLHTTLSYLIQSPVNQFPLINEKKKEKKGAKYKNSGVLILNSIKTEIVHSFLDYIQGGLQVNFTIGIDFTGSNGPPTDPNSLHYLGREGEDNQYSTAIKAVGEVIQDYDYDRMFPCLGFGAKVPPTGEVSHEFFLTLDPGNPFCAGITGVMAAYQRCVTNVHFYGPTNFSPVIEHVAQFARAHNGEASNYFVLLIITDGVITDIEATKRSIVNASLLPMSIIIVGVGEEDFSAMELLDGDNRQLAYQGKVAERDIVQFVELRKFIKGGGWSKEVLAKAVLAEVPNQVLSYMKRNGLKPGSRA